MKVSLLESAYNYLTFVGIRLRFLFMKVLNYYCKNTVMYWRKVYGKANSTDDTDCKFSQPVNNMMYFIGRKKLNFFHLPPGRYPKQNYKTDSIELKTIIFIYH